MTQPKSVRKIYKLFCSVFVVLSGVLLLLLNFVDALCVMSTVAAI